MIQAILVGVWCAAALGLIKEVLDWHDLDVPGFIKPFQPLIIGLMVATYLSVQLVPVAIVAAVVTREVVQRMARYFASDIDWE